MSLLEVKALEAGYDGKDVLKKISLNVNEGEIVGILGANGCGKTTLLKVIGNLLPHRGRCQLNQVCMEDISPRELARACGYIPQKSGISIDLTVMDVVLMGFNPQLSLFQSPTGAMKEEARQALFRTGLGERLHDNFQQLSEGQKQLCLFARTFVGNRRLLLLDEPESALDFNLRYKAMDLLEDYIHRKQAAALITLHDSALALNHCDRLLLLSEGTISGEIAPSHTPIPEMESILSAVYGPVSIAKLRDRQNREKLVMLKENF